MARIAGNDLPKNKRGIIALTYVYGVGLTTSGKILDDLKIDRDKKVKDWSDDEITQINKYIAENLTVEGELRTEVQMSIKRLMDIVSYRGLRHRKGLPLRGQRTKNNSRTRKGRRKTVANKKKAIK
ncbi:MAG: 30S ribosomal protein S13 [Bacteroidetes bacterium]|jgi:small subunit ribosomal protein S13|nr:MAG: 30S ribosomal protein S13 [Bacteroidota bacterium]HAB90309.1 30S ribosomal protein S13 [Bacteroidota bacterium]|tara:strand:- start:1770 stop:2147 length:378 start_codon:yes stop_codon:yes gene_type:complete